jgi:hypothetical protein
VESGRAYVSTTYIARGVETPGGDLDKIKPGDLVFCKTDLDKWFGRERLILPAGRLMVFYGFTHPGRAVIYGIFDADDGAQRQVHRMVQVWAFPLWLHQSGVMNMQVWEPEDEAGEEEEGEGGEV